MPRQLIKKNAMMMLELNSFASNDDTGPRGRWRIAPAAKEEASPSPCVASSFMKREMDPVEAPQKQNQPHQTQQEQTPDEALSLSSSSSPPMSSGVEDALDPRNFFQFRQQHLSDSIGDSSLSASSFFRGGGSSCLLREGDLDRVDVEEELMASYIEQQQDAMRKQQQLMHDRQEQTARQFESFRPFPQQEQADAELIVSSSPSSFSPSISSRNPSISFLEVNRVIVEDEYDEGLDSDSILKRIVTSSILSPSSPSCSFGFSAAATSP